MLSMSYYSNQLGAYFSSESILIHAMGLIIRKNKDQRASLQELTDIGSTIQDIFKNEFLLE